MIVFWLCIVITGFGMFRGFHEGAIMEQGGVRNSGLFKYYHRFGMLRDLSGVLVGLLAARSPIWSTFYFVTAAIVAHWQGMEACYSIARYGTPLPVTENFLGLGIYLDSTDTLIVHILRYTAIITLTIVGLNV